jgi:signal transduction histidine kinase
MKNINSSKLKKPHGNSITLSLEEKILIAIAEPICVINADRTFAFMNQAMFEFTGASEDIKGKTLSALQLPFNAIEEFTQQVDHAFKTAKITEGSSRFFNLVNEKMQLSFTWTPFLAQDGSVEMITGIGHIKMVDQQEADLLESKERQNFLLRLSDALRPLSETAAIQQEATRLLGEHLDVDRTYYASCDESLQLAVIERDYVRNNAPSLVGIHHYADFEAIVKTIRTGKAFLAEDVLYMSEVQPQLESYLGNQMQALVAVPLMKDGQMVACLAITSSVPRRWSQGEISLLEQAAERTWEAVERGRYESALKKNEQLMSTIFESLPVGVGLIENDGRILLSNKELHLYLPEKIMPSVDNKVAARWKAWDDQGNPLEQSSYPGVRASRGESVLPGIEMLYTDKNGKKIWTQVAAVPFGNAAGKNNKLITVITNIDHIKRATRALEEIEQQFWAFVAASSDLVYRMSADWQQMYTLSGSGFLRETSEPLSNWLQWYIPIADQTIVKKVIEQAIATKSMFEFEHRVNLANGAIGWVISRAIPLLDEFGNIREWLGAANDITSRKTAEEQLQDFASRLEQEVNARTQELKASRDQLQSILDTSLMQMSILQAVRDEHGEVVDIEIKLVNKKHEQVMGRTDLIGLHYVKEYPGMKKSVLFELIVKTIETGEPQETEYYYPYEGFNSWYASMFVKLNDGVVAFTMDISARKNAEEERFKNYLLLQQSEEMALMGSWDFDVTTSVFSWSKGMYRLFDLKERTEISPEIYLRYTTDNGRPAAERVVNHIRNGDEDFQETLEININEKIKILQLKATVVRDEQGQTVRVLGVDMDNTASRAADEKIRQMEAQQQELIFRTALASQEEERRRISESLHNGLGQSLYAIKINLSLLTLEHAIKQPEKYRMDKKYTEELLISAIAESRRISHQLVPSILEDFGLKDAVIDVCSQLNTKIEFNCKIIGFDKRLNKYIELAVFRVVQELILNVAKHSGATKASVDVRVKGGDIQIEVTDNGRGMQSDSHVKPGIGLASIRSKIKLLNGIVKIESGLGEGTKVIVHMPISS